MSASPISLLVQAEEQALAADERLDSLLLDPLARGLPDIPVAERIVQATSTLTIDGASSLTLGIHDPDWLIESSGILTNEHGRLATIDLRLDGLVYRLVQASRRDPDTLTLTFEDLLVALLREHTDPMTASRGSMTRAQFIERMVREVDPITIPFYSPDKGVTQRTARPDFPDATPKRGDGGFDEGARVRIKGALATATQMRNLATALTVADQEGASPRVLVAMLVAGIGESSFEVVKNPGSVYSGVFQADPANIPMKDTAQQARYFLRGGKGFQVGGAMAAAREHPDWSAGTIAYKVEGDRRNFSSDAAAEHFYQEWHAEALAIADAWNRGAGHDSSSDNVLRIKAFQFTRGLAGKRESSWDAARRLAEEVNWRFYVEGGVAVFISDDRLMLTPASAAIGFDDPVLIDRPSYDLDHGKPLQTCELQVTANLWALRAGDILALSDRRFGSAFGRWIVETVEQNLLDATDTTVTLIKPLPPRLEPAAEVVETTVPKTRGRYHPHPGAKVASAPLSRSGHLIGKPYEGTHAKAFNIAGGSDNWESENAVDIGTPVGTLVLAVDTGTIGSSFGSLGQGGRFAGLRLHLVTSDNEWYYAHLERFAPGIKPGAKVKAGELLGYSGEANGVAHLHLASAHGDPVSLLGVGAGS